MNETNYADYGTVLEMVKQGYNDYTELIYVDFNLMTREEANEYCDKFSPYDVKPAPTINEAEIWFQKNNKKMK